MLVALVTPRSCRQRQFVSKAGYAGFDAPQLCSSLMLQAKIFGILAGMTRKTVVVVCTRLVLLVTMHLVLCSCPWSAGPGCVRASPEEFLGRLLVIFSMDLAYTCVKHQMRLYVCHQMRAEFTTEFASLGYLLLASFASIFRQQSKWTQKWTQMDPKWTNGPTR